MSVFILVNDKDMENNHTEENNHTGENNHTIVSIPAPRSKDDNWKTIDNAVLYDQNQYDLDKCDLNEIYRIFE